MPIQPSHSRTCRISMLTSIAAASSLACNTLDDSKENASGRVVPTDTRPAIQADAPPPPLSGGTVTVTRDGRFAAVADEARHRVSIVDLTTRQWQGDVSFPGSRPGRVVEADDGVVFVVLRDAGAIASIRLADRALLAQHDVCAAPRGIAFDAARSQLHVACASGRFVTLTTGGEVVRGTMLPNDLRDVVVERGNVWVSRFRSAEVLLLDAEGNVAERSRPPTLSLPRLEPDGFTEVSARFEANVGWRLTANPAGGVVLVHQRGTTEEIDLTSETENGGLPYGGGAFGFDCRNGIQRSSVTSFDVGGRVTPGPNVALSLPLDIAVSFDGGAVVVGAGREDFGTPRSSFVSVSSGGTFVSGRGPSFSGAGVTAFDTGVMADSGLCVVDGLAGAPPIEGAEQYVVAVAARPLVARSYVVQTREPAQLVLVSEGSSSPILLGGESVADTGFNLFHRNAEAGISCASCHPDGTDDGHVWNFQGQGPRSTQPLDVGLEGTAPFHWDGSLPEVGELMGEVFVGRMGGVHESPERLDALERWLFALSAPAPEAPIDERRVDRGRSLFHSFELGCADCHRGARFTDNNNYDVGTGEPGEKFQVPSLIGVGTRSTLIHTGCARSLRERFELDCAGGDRHGKVSQLGEGDIDDLVAYLETL